MLIAITSITRASAESPVPTASPAATPTQEDRDFERRAGPAPPNAPNELVPRIVLDRILRQVPSRKHLIIDSVTGPEKSRSPGGQPCWSYFVSFRQAMGPGAFRLFKREFLVQTGRVIAEP